MSTVHNIKTTNDFIINSKLSGRHILQTPEGLGKSYEIIKQCLNDTSDRFVIYNNHSINNSIEKYNTALELSKSLGTIREAVRIKSDSEIFRDTVAVHNPFIAELFKNTERDDIDGYLEIQIISFDKKEKKLKQVNYGPSYKKKIKRLLDNNTSRKEFNSILISDAYNQLTKTKNKKDYFLLVKVLKNINLKNYNKKESVTKNINSILFKYNEIEELKRLVAPYEIVHMTNAMYKRILKEKIERDNLLKNIINSNNKYVVFSQSKTTENYIIPKLLTNEIKSIIINDEISESDLILYDSKNISKIENIITKLKYNENLTFAEKNLVRDLNIENKIKKMIENDEKDNLSLNHVSFHINDLHCFSAINIPKFCSRLTYTEDNIILTSETLVPEIIRHALNFDIWKVDSEYSFNDNKFYIFETSNRTSLNIIKDEKENIKDFINKLYEYKNSKNNSLMVGTTYFGTEFSLAATKGNNFKNINRMNIFTNPNNRNRGNKLRLFINTFLTEDSQKEQKQDLLQNLNVYIRVDELNQTIARISGYRRKYFNKTKITLFYNTYDSDLKKALDLIRYKGIPVSEKFTNKYVKMVNYLHSKIIDKYTFLDSILSIKDTFTLEHTLREVNITKSGLINLCENYYKPYLKNEMYSNMNMFTALFTKRFNKIFKSINDIDLNFIKKQDGYDILSSLEYKNDFTKYVDNLLDIKTGLKLKNKIENTKNTFDFNTFVAVNFYTYLYEEVKVKNKFNIKYLKQSPLFVYEYAHTMEGIKSIVGRMKGRRNDLIRITPITFNPFEMIKSGNDDIKYGLFGNIIPNQFILDQKNNKVSSIMSGLMEAEYTSYKRYPILSSAYDISLKLNNRIIPSILDFIVDNCEFSLVRNYFNKFFKKNDPDFIEEYKSFFSSFYDYYVIVNNNFTSKNSLRDRTNSFVNYVKNNYSSLFLTKKSY
jgi:hypothetical protein